jgi:hypothetical protein
MSLEVFSAKFLAGVHENESRKIWILRSFHFFFCKIQNLQICRLIRKAKKSGKNPHFFDCAEKELKLNGRKPNIMLLHFFFKLQKDAHWVYF